MPVTIATSRMCGPRCAGLTWVVARAMQGMRSRIDTLCLVSRVSSLSMVNRRICGGDGPRDWDGSKTTIDKIPGIVYVASLARVSLMNRSSRVDRSGSSGGGGGGGPRGTTGCLRKSMASNALVCGVLAGLVVGGHHMTFTLSAYARGRKADVAGEIQAV